MDLHHYNRGRKIGQPRINLPNSICGLGNDLRNEIDTIESSFATLRDTMNQVDRMFGVEAQAGIAMDVKVDEAQANINAIAMKMQQAAHQEEERYQRTQLQLTIAISAASSSS